LRPLEEPGPSERQPRAEGPHSVFKRGPGGAITGYETFERQDNLSRDFFRGRPRQRNIDTDVGGIGLRKEIDSKIAE